MKKGLILLFGLIVALTLAATKAEIDRGKLTQLDFAPLPVGTIVQSLLTEAQFQAENGTGWVIMTGQSISGSRLHSIAGIATLPDARGRFLRTAGGDAGTLRALQAQATAKNGLSNSTSTVTGTTNIGHSHAASTVYINKNQWNDDQTAHNHRVDWRPFGVAGGGFEIRSALENINTQTVGPMGTSISTWGSVNATGSADGQTLATTNVSLASGSAAAQTISGDTETRPVNLTVNTFIKIN